MCDIVNTLIHTSKYQLMKEKRKAEATSLSVPSAKRLRKTQEKSTAAREDSHGSSWLDCPECEHEHGCPWHPETTWIAAVNGHLECLKYAHENGCPWHPYTTCTAAFSEELECLKYAHENGCPWHRDTTDLGNLECLKYAHKNGCPWRPNTTYDAAYHGNLERLKYIYEHCGDIVTWEDSDLENKFEEFSEECQNFIKSVKEEWKAGLNRPGSRTKPAIR